MGYIYTKWDARQYESIPIIELRGSCEAKNSYRFLLGQAVAILESAEKYGGIPYATINKVRVRSKKEEAVVKFAILFEKDKYLEKFVQEELM